MDISKENELNLLSEEEFMAKIDGYINFRKAVRQGNYGKTSLLWLAYMDHVWLMLGLIHSVKTNNFVEYTHSLYLMPDLFFSFGRYNYARYLTFFAVFLANIECSHPGATEMLERGAFSVARSFTPGNRSAVDSKCQVKRRWWNCCRTVRNFKGQEAYQRWTRTMSECKKYYQATLSLADMTTEICDGSSHKDLRKTEIAKSEKQVIKTIEAIKSFINIYDVEDHQKLYCLSSGVAVEMKTAPDVLWAENVGKEMKETFIKDRLEKKEMFFEPITKAKLKSMSSRTKSAKLLTSSNKVVQYKQEGIAAFGLLVLLYNHLGTRLDLQELMSYPLTPIPYSIAKAGGFFCQDKQSKGYGVNRKRCRWWAIRPSQWNFGHWRWKCNILLFVSSAREFQENCREDFQPHGTKKPFLIFSTGMYHPNSVKAVERLRRGSAAKLIVRGKNTKKPKE